MVHPLLASLKPVVRPWQRSRAWLALLVYVPPLLWLCWHGAASAAALFGLGVFVALLMDTGRDRWHRLEHMLIGVLTVVVGAFAGYAASAVSPLLWWGGLLLGFTALGAAFNAGIVLEIKLRNLGLGYLVGKLPMLLPLPLLPYALAGAGWTMLLSLLLAPAVHNPFPLPQSPSWRADWLAGRNGRFVGLRFGLLLAGAVASSMALALQLALLSPAVAGTATLFVLRPDHGRTLVLLWQRLCGVLAAALLAYLLFLVAGNPVVYGGVASLCLAALPLALASGMPWLVFNNTLLLFMLLGLLGLKGSGAVFSIEFRVLDTLLGCAVAGLAGTLWQRIASREV